jgi:hypothetical protein
MRRGCNKIVTPRQKTFVFAFQNISAFLLFATAAAKLVSAVGSQGILDVTDPILGIPNRVLLICVGLLELSIGGALLWNRKPSFSLLCTSMLGAQFMLYHVIVVRGNFPKGCPCLGTITQWLPVSEDTTNLVLFLIAMWLCAGGSLSFYFTFASAKLQQRESV